MEMEITEWNEGLLLEGVRDFEPSHTFECGQCFRWNRDADGSYVGVAGGKAVRLAWMNGTLHIKGAYMEDADFWMDYLDLGRDYGTIKEGYKADPILREAVQYGDGLRILNQEQFETIISFIISANNMMPRIKRIVEALSRRYGRRIKFEGKDYFAFPTPKELSEATAAELQECGCGYRAGYIVDSSKKIATREFDIAAVMEKELDEAQKDLMRLSGVGPKVADCILLFCMKKTRAFPVDVWVKRVMQHFYTAPDTSLKNIRTFGMEQFGVHAGIAQQYLFYYARENKIGTK